MNDKEVMCSFIVPFYNVQTYIAECIKSILNQTYGNLELILIDDGSKDDSLQVCMGFVEKDKRVTVISIEHSGVTQARKEGARIAKGKYVLCVDADDWIEEDTLEKLLSLGEKADVYTFCYYEEGAGYKGIKKNNYKEGFYTVGNGIEDFYGKMLMDKEKFDQGVFSSLCNKMILKEIFVRNQMQVPDSLYYGEDTACTFPCLLEAKRLYVTNLALYHYRLRPDSCVRSATIKKENFKTLYVYLQGRFAHSIFQKILNEQLSLYMWQALLLKGYMYIETTMHLFPFEKVRPGMKVAIYGAGLFGQVIEQYCRNNNISVTGWFDKRYEVYVKQGMPVKPPIDVVNAKFDIMVIAILNIELAEKIKEECLQKEISEEKIDYVNTDILNIIALPLVN